jgi:hypothetical protein
VATLTTGHGTVVSVLGKAVSETVTNEHTLEVDVALLMLQDLVGKDRDVVASIRLSSNVEILLSILRELLEEEGEEGIDVLAGSNSVAHTSTAVRVTNIDGLVEEDDGSIVVPCGGVVDELELLVNRGRAQLKEETCERGAAWATVEPEDNWVVLGVVAGLEEP